MKKYILVTVMKDEAKNIPGLAESVVDQDIAPVLWVIVDDGSTDNTARLLSGLASKHRWIRIIKLKKGNRDLGFHYAEICRTGFDTAIDECRKKKMSYDYIALVDADIILPKDYFSSLMAEFENDGRLGIASGNLGYYAKDGSVFYPAEKTDLVCGAARMWKKECFMETKGYQRVMSPDTVSNILAALGGWKIMRFRDITMVQTRKTSSCNGINKGSFDFGERYHYLGFNPIRAILKTIRFFSSFELSEGFFFLMGYFKSSFSGKEQVNIKEVREYNRRKIW